MLLDGGDVRVGELREGGHHAVLSEGGRTSEIQAFRHPSRENAANSRYLHRKAFDETLATFSHPRYELVATGQVFDGPDEVMAYYRSSRAAFPDQRNVVHAMHHADDAVIVEFDLLGTHGGEFLGVPATGKTFACRMAAVFAFDASDRIVCERVYFDAATILRQLGIGSA